MGKKGQVDVTGTQLSPRHKIGPQQKTVPFRQRLVLVGFFSYQIYVFFSISMAFAKLCHTYTPPFIPLKSLPFLVSYIGINIQASLVFLEKNKEEI